MPTIHRNYRIYYCRSAPGHDYTFVHKDYDGPEDNRCGTGASVQDCIEQIDERGGDE